MRLVMLNWGVALGAPFLVRITTTPLVAREPYIAVAAADLRNSTDSISSGFKSASRFTRAS